jgi:hypothetical protein
MAIRHIATLLCDYLIRSDDGRYTLVGLFKNIEARPGAKLPIIKSPMGIYVEFLAEGGESVEVILKGPGKFSHQLFQSHLAVPETTLLRYQQRSASIGITAQPAAFEREGVYSIVLKSGNKTIHTHRFGVIIKPAQSGEDEDEE